MSGTYLSLFSGIGGLDLAVEEFGWRCVGQVEYEPACAAVLERHWPDVPRWGDVHGFTAAAYAERGAVWDEPGRRDGQGGTGQAEPRPHDAPSSDTDGRGRIGVGIPAGGTLTSEPRRDDAVGLGDERVGLIIGGYPCQPFSHAGKRGGTDDPRHLWPEFARLLGEFRPRFALLENVPGHLSLGAREVLGDLTEIGYDARWTTVRASDVGAPHRRERWFCIAERTDPDGERRGVGRPGPLKEWHRRQPQPGSERLGEGAPDPSGTGHEGSGAAGGASGRSDLVAGDDGSPDGREVAPDAQDADGRTRGPVLEGGPGIRGSESRGFDWGPYAGAVERWERVMGPAPHPVDERGRLSPTFEEWMMGFPRGWVDGMARTPSMKALGNAVVPQQAVLAITRLAQMNQRSER